jgi:hypothetical protein
MLTPVMSRIAPTASLYSIEERRRGVLAPVIEHRQDHSLRAENVGPGWRDEISDSLRQLVFVSTGHGRPE